MPRVTVTISFKELDALVKLALEELRNPRDQVRFLLRRELRRLQLLSRPDLQDPENCPSEPQSNELCSNGNKSKVS